MLELAGFGYDHDVLVDVDVEFGVNIVLDDVAPHVGDGAVESDCIGILRTVTVLNFTGEH